MKKQNWFFVVAVMIAVMLMGLGSGYAVDTTWEGGDVESETKWETPANWDTGNVPTAVDKVIIPSVADQPTVPAAGGTCLSLEINPSAGGVTLTLAGNLTLVTGNTVTVLAGANATAITGAANLVTANAAFTVTNNSANTLTISCNQITGNAANLITFAGTNAGANNITVSGDIADGATTPVTVNMGALADVVTLSGTNTYTGLTTVSAGILDIRTAAALGGTGTGTTVASGASLQLQGAGITYAAEPLTLNGGTTALNNLSGGNTWAGTIAVDAASTIKNTAGAFIISGVITATTNTTFDCAAAMTVSGDMAAAAGKVIKSGTADLTLSGTNAYTGGTDITLGTLKASGGSAITNTGTVTITGGVAAVLQIVASEAIGSLSGGGDGGNVIIDTGQTLTVTQVGNTTFAGIIGVGPTNGILVKEGAGALTLSGANIYTGATTVNAGAIYFDAINTGSSAKTVASEAILGGAGTIVGDVTVNAGGIIKPGNAAGTPGTLSNNGTMTFNGNSKLVLNVVNANKDVLELTGANNLVVDAALTTIELEAGESYSVGVTVVLIGGTSTNEFTDNLPAGWSSIFTANTEVRLTYSTAVIPTLNEWGMIIAFLLLAGAGVMFMRKRRATNYA